VGRTPVKEDVGASWLAEQTCRSQILTPAHLTMVAGGVDMTTDLKGKASALILLGLLVAGFALPLFF
jgi:hypothetical protein